jgi:hypothetical protein
MNLPVKLDCTANKRFLKPERQTFLFVSIDVCLENYAISQFGQMNLNVSIAIDSSASMVGKKFDMAKDAAVHIVNSLKSTDYLSVVRFADNATVTVEKQRVENKAEISQRIQNMRLGNDTNLYDGLQKAYSELLGGYSGAPVTQKFSKKGIIAGLRKLFIAASSKTSEFSVSLPEANDQIRRIILLTDGIPTKKPTDEKSYLDLGRDLRKTGISVTALGMGEDYNEDLLTSIAEASGGKWLHVTDLSELPTIFVSELTEMKTVVIVKPEMHVRLMESAEIAGVYQMGTMVTRISQGDLVSSGNDYVIPIENLMAGQSSRIVLKIDFPPEPEGEYRVASIILSSASSDLRRDVNVIVSNDQSLWDSEDPLPRVSLDLMALTVLARKGVGNPIESKEVRDRIQEILRDHLTSTVVKNDPVLENMKQAVISVTNQTIIKGSDLSEEDKKKLKGETTIIIKKREVNQQ